MRNGTRLRFGTRSLLHVNLFVRGVLHPRSWWMGVVPIILFSLAIVLAARDYAAGAWLSFALGVIGILRELWPTLSEVFGSPPAHIEQDRDFQDDLIARLDPSPEEVRDDYSVVTIPQRPRQAVVRSPTVDRWLRNSGIGTVVSDRKRIEVEDRLRRHAGPMEVALRCRSRRSYRSDPPRMFLNRRKLGLTDSLASGQLTVAVHEIGYYHSVLSNELVTRLLESDSGIREVVFAGREMFPALPVTTPRGERMQLRRLADSGMADHIGISTLVVTRDRRLLVWNQGGSAQQSRRLVAPTGSGSCEWSDYVPNTPLKECVARAMEREFVEESFGGKSPKFAMKTRVVGYFRWIRRGAKPEFVGITWADIDASALQPYSLEVNVRRNASHSFEVSDLAALDRVLNSLGEADDVSVPLWVNVLALREAIADDPAEWANFLHIPA